ncbi:hypothetical protein BJX63DRAFT_429727 [Aspergillus granulosus]|uniref:Uncharacterized protein n=1 Tax=Aspergillus granulosus TaxID=176169 RepID=A0ABR4HPB8_9EURO
MPISLENLLKQPIENVRPVYVMKEGEADAGAQDEVLEDYKAGVKLDVGRVEVSGPFGDLNEEPAEQVCLVGFCVNHEGTESQKSLGIFSTKGGGRVDGAQYASALCSTCLGHAELKELDSTTVVERAGRADGEGVRHNPKDSAPGVLYPVAIELRPCSRRKRGWLLVRLQMLQNLHHVHVVAT